LKGATNETLLLKFNSHHQGNAYYRVPATKQSIFTIVHYAGKVKYFAKVCHSEHLMSELCHTDLRNIDRHKTYRSWVYHCCYGN